jgi:hypothetical protein
MRQDLVKLFEFLPTLTADSTSCEVLLTCGALRRGEISIDQQRQVVL